MTSDRDAHRKSGRPNHMYQPISNILYAPTIYLVALIFHVHFAIKYIYIYIYIQLWATALSMRPLSNDMCLLWIVVPQPQLPPHHRQLVQPKRTNEFWNKFENPKTEQSKSSINRRTVVIHKSSSISNEQRQSTLPIVFGLYYKPSPNFRQLKTAPKCVDDIPSIRQSQQRQMQKQPHANRIIISNQRWHQPNSVAVSGDWFLAFPSHLAQIRRQIIWRSIEPPVVGGPIVLKRSRKGCPTQTLRSSTVITKVFVSKIQIEPNMCEPLRTHFDAFRQPDK